MSCPEAALGLSPGKIASTVFNVLENILGANYGTGETHGSVENDDTKLKIMKIEQAVQLPKMKKDPQPGNKIDPGLSAESGVRENAKRMLNKYGQAAVPRLEGTA